MRKERKLILQGTVPIGYQEGKTAVLDSEFMGCAVGRKLTLSGCSIQWRDGIADLLLQEQKGKRTKGGRVCVYQLKAEAAPEKKFSSYESLCSQYGGIQREDYQLVFNGTVEYENLNELYEQFTAETPPKGFRGRRLSLSDLLELFQQDNSALYYVDTEDFILTNWKENEHE